MPFEEIDKKIKEAADNHHPAYDEKAWDKMDALLNKHMPEKKERRRVALWLLLLLMTVGGAGYFIITKTNTHNPATVVNDNKALPKIESSNTINDQKPITIGSSLDETNKQDNLPSVNSSSVPTKQKNKNQPLAVIRQKRDNTKNKLLQGTENFNNQSSHLITSHQPVLNYPNPSINTSNDKELSSPVSKDKIEIKPAEKEKQATVFSLEPNQQSLTQQTENASNKKAKIKKGNGLFFSLSAGPDVGAVELNSIGRLKFAAGIGIGYKFSDRISLQTGFYSTRKIYTASAYDYKAPSWWWAYYPTLESVDADCKVYEIPLLVNYNFTRNKKANWFGTAGLSSYLMKKEAYDYNYKTGTGQQATRSWVYNNENKHYFSVLTLAGGYERNLNNQLSLSFSPYLKIPLRGIGFGNVKLNSAGVLISANFKPFVKK